MHLQQVHTPWKPGKAELSRRTRIRRRLQGASHQIFKMYNNPSVSDAIFLDNPILKGMPKVQNGESREDYHTKILKRELGSVWNRDGKLMPIEWDPSVEEQKDWNIRLLEIVKQVEETASVDSQDTKTNVNHKTVQSREKLEEESCSDNQPSKRQKLSSTNEYIRAGLDRNGQKVQSYKDSLPDFLKAAAEGDLTQLQATVQECMQKCQSASCASEKAPVQELLETRDRNGSTAEHWAAGGGHLSCLKYLFQISSRPICSATMQSDKDSSSKKDLETKKRRRDGKTCLHYAARNGHDHIIKYICSSNHSNGNVDIPAGDGTTPLHLACYGGHLTTIQLLVDNYKADLHRVNEWGCGVGHWTAMSIHPEPSNVVMVLDYLQKNTDRRSFEVFGAAQKQGHSAVHKACQKLNKHVIKWLAKEAKNEWTAAQREKAGLPDTGKNNPSSIWRLCGGDESFAQWISDVCGW